MPFVMFYTYVVSYSMNNEHYEMKRVVLYDVDAHYADMIFDEIFFIA